MSVPEELVDTTLPPPVTEYDPATENPERHAIEEMRDKIHMEAADHESLLGTTANAAQLMLYLIAELVAGLNAATTLAEMRTAAQPANDLLAAFKTKVDDGTVKLPYRIYPIEAVMDEIETRATKVHDVIAAAVAAQQT